MPFLPARSLKTLSIYAGVTSLHGKTKYLVADGKWVTNYGHMQQIPLQLKGITAIRIDSDPKFRAGWKFWRRWCKETDKQTVIPGTEGRREGDLQDDCDLEDELDESEHSYKESDKYAGEDNKDELPKKNTRSTESHGKGKAPSKPRRMCLSVKQGGGNDLATLATVKSSTPAEQPNKRVGDMLCEDDWHGSTAQAEGRSGTSDEDHQPAGPRKHTRLTMDKIS
ncbi:hypothetical protein FRC06_011900 [Ceratobasidium sp. 370]|nr:hypothetical protein FRC06_011900 [Ceratobasidium sp. 370]